MTTDRFEVTPVDDGVVAIQVATDASPYLDAAWAQGLITALEVVGRDEQVRAVVLEGGDRVFCAGASREALLNAGRRDDDVIGYAGRVSRALLAVPIPLVAAMAGHATGGGLLVGLLCDTAVLAEESLYGANFMALGFTPGMGASVVMEEAFGPLLGRQLLFTGELVTGRRIREANCPLSHAVHPRDRVRDRARELARTMAAAPRNALVLLRQMIRARRGVPLDLALTAERASHARLFADPRTYDEIAGRYPRPDKPAAQS
jgi:enoyl-CoA hydratase/carnithine racemase